ncbi:MAG: glycosyl hydrolase family 28-related protein [Mycobacterium sp.]
MSISRRRLILLAPAAVVLAACSPQEPRSVVNVRDHGAVGDGDTDDSAAITAAAAALGPGSVLHFPGGRYRFAQRNPSSAAAIYIAGISGVGIDFAQDAEILMDNVDPRTNTGTSHGVLIRGPASDISLHNVRIRWVAQTQRSMGDGIRIVGYPDDLDTAPAGWTGPAAPVRGVTISQCSITSAPQAGVVMTGVSDIVVTDLHAEHTRADGLHFNACRNAKVSGHTAVDTGDDGLALVTYFADEYTFDPAAETFAFPELTEWSNADFTIDNVNVSGGRANGMRLAGAHRVVVNGLTVADVQHGAAVMIDSSTAGHDVDWEYAASRELRLSGVDAEDCETGIHVLARPATAVDRRFTDFDVEIADARLSRCTNWSVRVESLSDQPATGVSLTRCTIEATSAAGGNGGLGLANTDGVHLGQVAIDHAQAVTTFAAINTGRLTVDDLALTVTQPTAPEDVAPCARFENTDAVINTMAVRWPAAPPPWQPVQLAPAAACDAVSSPLVVHTVVAEPSFLAGRIITC